jgi:hypothetical protein
MRTNLETLLRRDLSTRMRSKWTLTWHEDREVSPGVLDVSYVMKEPGHETGWLELKAPIPSNPGVLIKVEPSQHEWIDVHYGRVPLHFLVAVGSRWFFVDAKWHRRFATRITHDALDLISIASFEGKDIAENSYLFSNATRRNR